MKGGAKWLVQIMPGQYNLLSGYFSLPLSIDRDQLNIHIPVSEVFSNHILQIANYLFCI